MQKTCIGCCCEFAGDVAAKSVAFYSYINLILIAGWSFFFGRTFDVTGLMLGDLNKCRVDFYWNEEEEEQYFTLIFHQESSVLYAKIEFVTFT